MREMHAAELMTPDPIVVEPNTPIADVAHALEHHEIGSVPVVQSRRDKRLLGMITDRDIAVRCTAHRHDPTQCTAERHMSREPVAVNVEDSLPQVMRSMQGRQLRRLPVVDAGERVIGIIAQADVAVDAVMEDATSELDVAYTLRRVSEPAHPERKGS